MGLAKTILFTAISLFLGWQSVKLVGNMFLVREQAVLLQIFMAVLLNLFITGTFAFIGFVLPTYQLLPASYYRIKNERSVRKWYRNFKVDWFRNFLLATFWKNKKQQSDFFDGSRKGIDHLMTESKKAEFGHLCPAIIIYLVSLALLIDRYFLMAFIALIINLFFNVYPILLQRQHRMRITVMKARYASSHYSTGKSK